MRLSASFNFSYFFFIFPFFLQRVAVKSLCLSRFFLNAEWIKFNDWGTVPRKLSESISNSMTPNELVSLSFQAPLKASESFGLPQNTPVGLSGATLHDWIFLSRGPYYKRKSLLKAKHLNTKANAYWNPPWSTTTGKSSSFDPVSRRFLLTIIFQG